MKRQYQLYGKNREVFLRGLQRYRDRGVAILVDGREADASEWIKILEVQADGSFYMGDYIMDDFSGPGEEKPGAMVCEDQGRYGAEQPGQEEKKEVRKGSDSSGAYHMGMLKEIRFDRVYNR